ncbi:MAG: hypothetical protein WCL11_24915 [Verrucomicrobiota bacterium]
MPYFIILPVYALLICGLSIAAVATRFVPKVRPASGYIVGGILGMIPGFILANVIVTLAGLLPVWASQKVTLPQWLESAMKIFVAAVLLLGPFAASAVGVLVGFALGALIVFRRRRRHAV